MPELEALDLEHMLFHGAEDLARVLIVGAAAYVGLIILLRITGKRTLSKMNAFDLIVTVAFGSTLASALLSSEVSLAEAMLAFALLCFLQYVVTFVSVRSEKVQAVVKARPTLLAFRGRFLPDAMRRERVSEEEMLAALRAEGVALRSHALAVVLETDGSFSVVAGPEGAEIDTLHYVRGAEERPRPAFEAPPIR